MSIGRRPLKSRGMAWAKSGAAAIARLGITPNQISVLSMVFALLAGASFVYARENSLALVFAAVFIQLRLLCNLMDGMVAIEHNKKSPLGDIYNEVPDRFSDVVIIAGVGFFCRDFPYGIELAALACLLAVTTAYIRLLGAALVNQHFFEGPMAKQNRMALLTLVSLLMFLDFQIGSAPKNLLALSLIVMNIGMLVTIYRRLSRVVQASQGK